MTITRFDPFQEFAALRGRAHRVLGDIYLGAHEAVDAQGKWVPPVDIFETDGHDFVLKAELPDMKREDIEVTVENDTLTLRGQRSPDSDVKEAQYRRVERTYGSFNRSFALPSSVDASRVTADYKNGVLTIRLPFREDAKPRTVQIAEAA